MSALPSLQDDGKQPLAAIHTHKLLLWPLAAPPHFKPRANLFLPKAAPFLAHLYVHHLPSTALPFHLDIFRIKTV